MFFIRKDKKQTISSFNAWRENQYALDDERSSGNDRVFRPTAGIPKPDGETATWFSTVARTPAWLPKRWLVVRWTLLVGGSPEKFAQNCRLYFSSIVFHSVGIVFGRV